MSQCNVFRSVVVGCAVDKQLRIRGADKSVCFPITHRRTKVLSPAWPGELQSSCANGIGQYIGFVWAQRVIVQSCVARYSSGGGHV